MLNYEFPPLGGGAANTIFYLLKGLSKDPTVEITLITSSINEYKEEYFSKNIKIIYLNIYKKGKLQHQSLFNILVYSIKSYIKSRKLVRVENFDFTHAFFGIPCGYIAMKLKIPYIVSLMGSDIPFHNERFNLLDKLFFQKLSKKIWCNSKCVLANSLYAKNKSKESSPDQHIDVIYNGIDLAEFSPKANHLTGDSDINIIFVGRLTEIKGFIYLLNAFETLSKKYKNIKLQVVGDGNLKDVFVKQVDRCNLSEKVIFHGLVDHEEIATYYQNSDIAVIPSLNESHPNVVQEAMACGLPVITTDTGASEHIDGNGYIVDKKSSKDIAEKLELLITNKNLRKEMSIKSRSVAMNMSWNKTCLSYKNIYKKALE